MPAGRRPKLKEDKASRGTLRPGRDPEACPAPIVGVPQAPPWLSEYALEYWAKLSKTLAARKQLTLDDYYALEACCECYSEWRTALEDMKEGGRYQDVTTGSGDTMERIRPCVSVYQSADMRLKGYLIEFGLTAVSRAKVPLDDDGARKPHGRKRGEEEAAGSGQAPADPLDRYGLN